MWRRRRWAPAPRRGNQRMLKKLIAAAGCALLLAAPAMAAEPAAKDTKAHKMGKKHGSKAHHCVDKDGKEIMTTEKSQGDKKDHYGKTVRRAKTCKKEGGDWKLK